MGNKNRLAAIPAKNVFVIILRNDLGDEASEEVVGEFFCFNVQVQKLQKDCEKQRKYWWNGI